MPLKYPTKQERILKFANEMFHGQEISSRDVVVALRNRGITTRTVGQIFSSIPDVLEMVPITNHTTVWRRK